jgi:uncharacterized membrane protein YedE/YeeE
MRLATAFAMGCLFAVGLAIAGMTSPDKVVHFLTASAIWDPSLALVMVGGIGTHLLLFRFIVKRPSPLVEESFRIPTRRDLTPRLVGGSALFGVGWALAGFCPGPALTSAGTLSSTPLLFVVAMVAGMALFRGVERFMSRQAGASQPAK